MSASEWIFLLLVVAGLGGLVVYALRYSNWLGDKDPDDRYVEPFEEHPPEPPPMASPPKPVIGWEWVGLIARDALSLIPPDKEGTYTVRIGDDGSFSVRKDAP